MGKTILVVDDFASIRQHVCDTLEKKGYRVVGVSNGNEAFSTLVSNPGDFDLVLSDYNMPDCTGFELLKRIKSNVSIKQIPVVFLTTEVNPEKMKMAKNEGLSAWIIKPYRIETFLSQINNALKNHVKTFKQ